MTGDQGVFGPSVTTSPPAATLENHPFPRAHGDRFFSKYFLPLNGGNKSGREIVRCELLLHNSLRAGVAVPEVFKMEHRARHQTASTYYSPYSRQIESLLAESPLHLVPEIERSGLEWFDIWVLEMMDEASNRDQDVPCSLLCDNAEKMLNSQDTDFEVPSTPIDHKLQDMVSTTDLTLVQNPSPQVQGVRLDPQPTATEKSGLPPNNVKQKKAAYSSEGCGVASDLLLS
ncbi:uncharacterized protein [Narcine bancroftii]|uniref:uncharacterized protein n=1 Tax=Narcine bancroftii TaxID=1343680 RepID=UPI003831427E